MYASGRKAIAVAVAAAVLLALGAAIGRWSAPTRTEDRIVLDERERVIYLRRSEVVTVAATKRTTATITRWEYLPGRTVVVREERENEESARETKAKTEEAGSQTKEQHIESVQLVEAPRADWSAVVRVGYSLDRRPVAGVGLERRLAGPFAVGAWADTTKAAGLSLRMNW